MLTEQVPLKRLRDVHIEMETVSDLRCLGRTNPRSFGIGTSPVPADHLDLRVLHQPRRQRLGRAIREQLYDLMRPQVHQNRAVALTPVLAFRTLATLLR